MASGPKQQELDLFHGHSLREATSFRSEREIMSMPFFGLSHIPRRKPVQRDLALDDGTTVFIRNSPGEFGIPTVFDRDILIYLATLLVDRMNRGEPVSKTIQFVVHDFLISVGKKPGGTEYKSFTQALQRLKGVTVYTNITTAETISDGGWSWIAEYQFHRTRDGSMARCEVTLGDWFFKAIVADRRFLVVNRDYFELTSGLDKAVYQIISRHIGNKPSWHISMEKLHLKTGSDSPLKRFSFDIRAMIERDPFPAWELHLTTDGRMPSAGSVQAPVKGRRGPVYLYVLKRGTPVPVFTSR